MAGIQEQVGGVAPPDEWLALSEAERAEVRRRAAEFGPDEMEAARGAEVQEASESHPESDAAGREPAPLPTIDDVLQSAESLEVDDRIRLTGRLLLSLPLKNRAALVTLGLESLEQSANEALRQARQNFGTPFWPMLWRFLFDPANTSRLYSAPRRFDLATIFVVTAAYSLLFGALTAMDFGPLELIVLGSVVTIVGVSQAVLLGVYNPRGVSVIAGAVSLTFFCLVLLVIQRRFLDNWFIIDIGAWIMVSPIVGYISGVMVGGVFLIADALRGRFQSSDVGSANDAPEGGAR